MHELLKNPKVNLDNHKKSVSYETKTPIILYKNINPIFCLYNENGYFYILNLSPDGWVKFNDIEIYPFTSKIIPKGPVNIYIDNNIDMSNVTTENTDKISYIFEHLSDNESSEDEFDWNGHGVIGSSIVEDPIEISKSLGNPGTSITKCKCNITHNRGELFLIHECKNKITIEIPSSITYHNIPISIEV